MERATFLRVGMALILFGFVAGCATTGGGERAVPAIPAGKGVLVLEAGGIGELNFSVFNQETGVRVAQRYGLDTYLDPGHYRVEVETDFTYPDLRRVVLDEIAIIEGQEKHVRVPVGRFMINVSQQSDASSYGSQRVQLPFRVYDFGRKTVLLDRGMTSTQAKHFIAPMGTYKVELTPRIFGEGGSHTEHIMKPIEVRFGSVYPLMIHLGGTPQAQPSQQGE
ncbi:MAG: hypothetical protein KAJ05_02145 [Candidatus Latescibacteria bacterium]|nr:hypothetical protein [Candidatus Latescibacterota bacterium]MCK5329535.1 hypothetical protein [Candidatus Latescibacterota bacterium]MCK5381786.1 hypothetical protein [Candidatus Latescibacterota bacterium]MCK5525920.1 hypothetical protein [Candidatus Latescibacterota bacterium]MCK5733976.1 hypothetical protein [Candidatus Latescibacterota bacterium]